MDSGSDGEEQIDARSTPPSPALMNENLDEAQSQCSEETVMLNRTTHQPDYYQTCHSCLKGIPSDLESVPASVKTSDSEDPPPSLSADRNWIQEVMEESLEIAHCDPHQELGSGADEKNSKDTSSLMYFAVKAQCSEDTKEDVMYDSAVNQQNPYQKCQSWLREIPSDQESVPASVKTSNSKDFPLNFSANRTQTSRPAFKPNIPCRANKAEMERSYESENFRRFNRTDNDDSGVWTDSEIDLTAINNSPESRFRSSMRKTKTTQKRKSTPQQEFQSEDVKKKSSISFWMALLPVAVLMLVTGLVIGYGYSKEHKVGHHELRLMLVGKTGAGKRVSGNTILGEEAFRVEASPASVTAHCEKRNKVVDGRNITVIDTPGVMDTWLISNQTAHSEPVCIHHPAHHPHVFLLLIRLGRFTEEERNAVKWIQENFGEEAVKFTMILFTGGDLLERKPIEKFISNSVELQNLVDTCEGRYHVFNNNQKNNHAQVTELLEKIDLLLFRSLGYIHTQEVHQRIQHNIREEEEKKKLILIKEIQSEESLKRDTMERIIRLEEELKRSQMEEEMKAEGLRKMNEMTVKLRDEQYENQKLQAELEKADNTKFWLWVVILCTSPLYLWIFCVVVRAVVMF